MIARGISSRVLVKIMGHECAIKSPRRKEGYFLCEQGAGRLFAQLMTHSF